MFLAALVEANRSIWDFNLQHSFTHLSLLRRKHGAWGSSTPLSDQIKPITISEKTSCWEREENEDSLLSAVD